jgi:EmrB/QacA subfamily drug resistance transporter
MSDRLDPALLKLAGIVLFGAIAAQLDLTMVNVALDDLTREFHASVTTIQWVATGYLLAYAVVLPVSGWATDRFGAKRVWLFALTLFLVGSVLCGAAWSAGSLIGFRILQGLGGGLLIPLMQTILARAAGPQRLMRLMAVIAVPAMLAPIVGPVLGGFLVDDVGWRWIFYVNVPVCLVGLVLAWRGLPDTPPEPAHPLDGVGLALLSPGLALVVYGCAQAGGTDGFGAAGALWPIVSGTVLLVLFVVHALRTRTVPLIDVRLFRSRAFTGSALLMFVFGISLFGAMLLLPLYYQQVRGATALEAGLLLAPQGLGTMVALVVASRLGERFGPRAIVLAGIALSVVGTLPFALADGATSEVLLGLALVVRGAGLGAAMVPVMATSYHGLDQRDYPRATGAVRIFQQVGGSFGTAVLAVLLQQGAVDSGLVTAFGDTFWWTVGFAVVALLPALLLPGRPRAEAAAPGAPVPVGRTDG